MSGVKTVKQLIDTLPQTGRVEWLSVRPQRRMPLKILSSVTANINTGLIGDRYAGSNGRRQVTLIQYEHLAVLASLLDLDQLDPALLRRNIAVSGINLLALKGKQFVIGGAILEHTGLCHPCSFIEKVLGAGGYNAVRGHGGITARVVNSGLICVGDAVANNPS